MSCLATFFDGMSGVKKLTKVHAVGDHTTLAGHPSNSVSILTPVMAPKNDARHGIDLFSARITQCHVWHRFLTPCLASKSIYTLYPQSIAQLRQTSLQLHTRLLATLLNEGSKAEVG